MNWRQAIHYSLENKVTASVNKVGALVEDLFGFMAATRLTTTLGVAPLTFVTIGTYSEEQLETIKMTEVDRAIPYSLAMDMATFTFNLSLFGLIELFVDNLFMLFQKQCASCAKLQESKICKITSLLIKVILLVIFNFGLLFAYFAQQPVATHAFGIFFLLPTLRCIHLDPAI